MSEYDDLLRRVSALERELAELKKKLEPEKPFVPRREMPKIDWTEGMRVDPESARAMAAVVPDVEKKPSMDEVLSSWARSKISGPSGGA